MKMTYSRNILLVCLPLWLFLACGQENKQPRNSPMKASEQEIDSLEQAEYNQKAAEAQRLAEEAQLNQQKDSLFLARLRRLDTVFVGKGLRLHCKSTTEPFRYENGDIESIAKELHIRLPEEFNDLSPEKRAEKENAIQDASEDKRIAKFADRVRRTKTHLEFRLANGQWLRLKLDKMRHERMRNPRFAGYIKEKSLYVVYMDCYEGDHFVVIDAQGNETDLMGAPICSPARKYFVSTQYGGFAGDRELLRFHLSHQLYLRRCDKPDKNVFFRRAQIDNKNKIPQNICDESELLGRVVWIQENVFLMEICSSYAYDDYPNRKPKFAVIRCEIEETNP